MTHIPLTIQANNSGGEIHVIDEQVHPVLKGTGEIHTSLLPGEYYVVVSGVAYPLELKGESASFEEPPFESFEGNDDLTGININQEPIELDWFISRRICPACERGILLGRRNKGTFEMLHEDNCILCGQQVQYKDLGLYGFATKGSDK
jgi:NAD-dependent dihydropyrimidine dehydrogenase PreA subunit